MTNPSQLLRLQEWHKVIVTPLLMVCCALPVKNAIPAPRQSTVPVIVEPDRPFARIGRWQISTARWGVGCVAEYEYEQYHSVFIGGQKREALVLNVTVNGSLFAQDLSSDDPIDLVELVVGSHRWGELDHLNPDGYRGRAGVLIPMNVELRNALLHAPSIKLTERGALKLRIPIKDVAKALAALDRCFVDTR